MALCTCLQVWRMAKDIASSHTATDDAMAAVTGYAAHVRAPSAMLVDGILGDTPTAAEGLHKVSAAFIAFALLNVYVIGWYG
jgi:hypothetical protein